MQLEFIGDSAIKYKDNFNIWFDKCKVGTQLGLIPLYYTTTTPGTLVFNIEPKDNLDNWCLKFNNDRDFLTISFHIQSCNVRAENDSLLVRFYHCVAAGTEQIGTLKVKWE